MEFGVDEDGNRVSIFHSDSSKKYSCPCCKSELIQKKGSVKVHHFAHKSKSECVDYYDNKGEWHREMQNLFPEKNREVFNNEYGENHFFDVLTDNNVIVEFQHSPMSIDLFNKRSNYYFIYSMEHSLSTYKFVWVFDFRDKKLYKDKSFISLDDNRECLLRLQRCSEFIHNIGDWLDRCEFWIALPIGIKHWIYGVKWRYAKVTYITTGSDLYSELYTENEFKSFVRSL